MRDCEQRSELNYEETFSPVISTSALRSLFAVAALKNLQMVTFDVKTALKHFFIEFWTKKSICTLRTAIIMETKYLN